MTDSLTEISLAAVLCLIALAILAVLLGPAITQVLATAGTIPAHYQTNDLESGANLMLESYVTNESHGASKHPDVYAIVSPACMTPDYRLIVRDSKKVHVCFIPDLGWGFQPWKKIGGNGQNTVWSERTAYIRNEIQSLQDLIQYARENHLTLEALQDGVWTVIQ